MQRQLVTPSDEQQLLRGLGQRHLGEPLAASQRCSGDEEVLQDEAQRLLVGSRHQRHAVELEPEAIQGLLGPFVLPMLSYSDAKHGTQRDSGCIDS